MQSHAEAGRHTHGARLDVPYHLVEALRMSQPRSQILAASLVGGIVGGIVGGLVAPAAAQSMAEAARRERERRAKQGAPTPAKVYTEADLEGHEGSAAAKPSPSPPSPAKAGAAQAASDAAARKEEAERKRLEADWRVRFADARRAISEAEARCWHKVVQTVFVAGIPVQQWVNQFEESDELRQRKRDLADLEEEFRRTGLPPGWARE